MRIVKRSGEEEGKESKMGKGKRLCETKRAVLAK